ncbi:MAG: hypothetical protein ACT4PW_04275 [Acidimicrobiia bacterium]
MNDPSWAAGLAALSIAAPVGGVVLAVVDRGRAGRWLRLGSLVAVAGWFVVLVGSGGVAPGDGLRPDGLGAAAALGAALVAAAATGPGRVNGAGPAASAIAVGAAWTTDGRPSTAALIAGLAIALLVAGLVPPARRLAVHVAPRPIGAGNLASVAAGIALLGLGANLGPGPQSAAAVAAGAIVVGVVAGCRPLGPLAVLVPGALLAGVRLLPSVPVNSATDAVAVLAAVAGLALAAATIGGVAPPGLRPAHHKFGHGWSSPAGRVALEPAAVLVPWTVAFAAAAPRLATGDSPARLLAASAVVALLLPRRVGLLVAVPGVVAGGAALMDASGRLPWVLSVVAVVTVALLVSEERPGPDGPGAAAVTVPQALAVAFGAWLVLAPSTWAWAGGAGTYGGGEDMAVAVAVAAGLAAAVAAGAVALRRTPAERPPPR